MEDKEPKKPRAKKVIELTLAEKITANAKNLVMQGNLSKQQKKSTKNC
mgnify:CR=1 FL=1